MPSQRNDSLITDDLLNALAQVESRNNPRAIGDKKLKHKAYGAYQIRQPALQDIQQRRKQYQGLRLEDIIGDPNIQRDLTKMYLDILEKDYGLSTLEQIIGGYNAGPGAARRGRLPTDYINKVKSYMGRTP